MATKPKHYLGNESLKAAGVQVEFTLEQVKDYDRCAKDPIYFIENYAKIVSLDKGVVLFNLFPYQRRLIKAIHENRMVVTKLFRQSGKSTTLAGYLAWYVLFNDYKRGAILANKAAIAREIFSRVQFIIENLPFWLQQGVLEWNKTSFELENGSSCFCAASSPSSIRGKSVNMLLLDEFAHLDNSLAEDFIASVFPTISSSEESKLILVSTPKGMNHFYKVWVDAEKGKNGFVPVEGHWSENPTRTQKWADEQMAILGKVRYEQEIACSFTGSAKTLLDGHKLANIVFHEPIFVKDKLKIYEEPQKDHAYACTVDTSRGQHLDYSAFTIFDITKVPYRVVATFKDNTIGIMTYPYMVYNTVKQYNDAYCLVEINDAGQEIANVLFYEFEYPNVYFSHQDKMTEGQGHPGVRTTKKVKSIGCSVLKELIEGDQLELNSYDIVQELSIFEQKGASYAAADTQINDDLTTTLWLFGWLTKQPLFADITNINIRKILAQKNEAYILENMTPFGEISDGLEEIRLQEMHSNNYTQRIDGVMTIDEWINS
jgi:hypothetical protein